MRMTVATAQSIIDRVRAQLASDGVEWQRSNVDGFRVGDPAISVAGIAVTFQPTLAVLQQALQRGLNLVISHEAAFWEGFDAPQIMPDDPLRLAKEAFVLENDMAIWRIHDHLHRMTPEPVFTALLRKLGWTPVPGSGPLPTVRVPEMRLDDLAQHLREALETDDITVVGDPSMPVQTIGSGAHILSSVLPALHSCDVAIAGETSEFDTFEYVRDANALGIPKAVIRISHERLEEWGMADFTEWLRPVVAELPVEWIPTGNPFIVP
jgi:putative NIF3 family GTP cyclohydrolase 1 type 2